MEITLSNVELKYVLLDAYDASVGASSMWLHKIVCFGTVFARREKRDLAMWDFSRGQSSSDGKIFTNSTACTLLATEPGVGGAAAYQLSKTHTVPLLLFAVYSIVPSSNMTPAMQLQAFARVDMRALAFERSGRRRLRSFFLNASDDGMFAIEFDFSVRNAIVGGGNIVADETLVAMRQLLPDHLTQALSAIPSNSGYVDSILPELGEIYTYCENGFNMPLCFYALASPEPYPQFDAAYLNRAGEAAVLMKLAPFRAQDAARVWADIATPEGMRRVALLCAAGHLMSDASMYTRLLVDLLTSMVQVYVLSTQYTADVSRIARRAAGSREPRRITSGVFINDPAVYTEDDVENMCYMPVTHTGDCEEGAFMICRAWEDVARYNGPDDTLIVMQQIATNYRPLMTLGVFTSPESGGHMTFLAVRRSNLIQQNLPAFIFVDSIALMHGTLADSSADCAWRARTTSAIESTLKANASRISLGGGVAKAGRLWQVLRISTDARPASFDSTAWSGELRICAFKMFPAFSALGDALSHSTIYPKNPPSTGNSSKLGALVGNLTFSLQPDVTLASWPATAYPSEVTDEVLRDLTRFKTPVIRMQGIRSLQASGADADVKLSPSSSRVCNIVVDCTVHINTVLSLLRNLGGGRWQIRTLTLTLAPNTPSLQIVQIVE